MKYNNSRLSLKQRWLSFALCILIALLAGIFALYSYIEAYPFWTSACSLLVCAIMLFIAIFLLRLNMRRKRIQREFVSEFDKEIRKKEHMCPPVSYTHLDVYKRQVRGLSICMAACYYG